MINSLLNIVSKNIKYNNSLERLEQDVWRIIHITNAEMMLPWYEKMILAFTIPKFKIASFAMALIMGLIISPAFISNPVTHKNILDMNIFTIKSPYLPSNLLGYVK